MRVFLKIPFQCIFQTISAFSESGKTVSLSVIEAEVETNTRHRIEFIFIVFVKGGQASIATGVRVTLFYVKINPTFFLFCVWQFVYVVYDNLSIFCMTIFLCFVWHILINNFVYIVYEIKSDFKFYTYYIINLILFIKK